jgi:hypothetical protein
MPPTIAAIAATAVIAASMIMTPVHRNCLNHGERETAR